MAKEPLISLDPIEAVSLYPPKLSELEAKRHKRRRIGVALSGGGIRSATLSLGFFQGLAKHGLVEFVDYLSTVSGGGYFGGFFGHLLHRPPKSAEEAIAKAATATPKVSKADTLLRDQDSAPFKFLRENGRYLSPNGAGDLMTAAAGMLRNWASVLIVLALLALFALTVLTMGRFWIEDIVSRIGGIPTINHPGWLSPLAIYVALLIPVLLVPPGWAYWLAPEKPQGDPWMIRVAKWGALVAGLALLGYMLWGAIRGTAWTAERWAIAGFGFLSLLVVLRYLVGRWAAKDAPQSIRLHLTRGLARALIFLFVLAAIALVDSVGLYIVGIATKGVAGIYAAIVAVVALFRDRLLGLATKLRANEKTSVPKSVLFALAAALLLIVSLGGIASIPHFVAPIDPRFGWFSPHASPAGAYMSLGVLAVVSGLLALAVSRVWSFVNRSSMHAVYEARIRRAYLGASNPQRFGEGDNRPASTEPHPNDGMKWNEYDPSKVGGPIHLVNVTINETVDGNSQVQQRDRKGVGMAIGPDGVSVGRTHHAVWGTRMKPSLFAEMAAGAQAFKYVMLGRKGLSSALHFRVFPPEKQAIPELLDVGQWVAISGGAVSTGLGARTNIALSVLIGFFNVRLGYWWKSGIEPEDRPGRTHRSGLARLMSLVRRMLPVHTALLDEWLARFPGTARREWNLTDGGHFENMGAYELLRRRLPLIIVCDNEEDGDYTFSGLANLVRKARTDLSAEIRFLDTTTVPSTSTGLTTSMPKDVGSLDRLRRGKPSTEKFESSEHVVVEAMQDRLSWAHAAVAAIEYKDPDGKADSTFGCMLYVKPTLTGDEPADVLQYHSEHPEFPQEPTSDQFFDEAQWESYRRLGEHIACKLFDRKLGLGDWMQRVANGEAPCASIPESC